MNDTGSGRNNKDIAINYIFKLCEAIVGYVWQPCQVDLGDMFSHVLLSLRPISQPWSVGH